MIPFRLSLVTCALCLWWGMAPQGKVSAPPATQKAPASADDHTLSPAFPPFTKPDPGYHLAFGQTLVFSTQWRVFNAGMVTIRVDQAGQEARVVGTADAAGAAALLFHVHDRFESFIDPAAFCSHNLAKNIEEGFRRVNLTINFDYQHGKAVLDQKNLRKGDSRHAENEIPGCVTDVLSSIYYVGALPLQLGQSYSFPVNDGGKTVGVEVNVEAREQIKTPAGTFNTLRVQPSTATQVLKDKKAQLWVWYTDDAAHTPVQVRCRMSWGMLTFTLQRIDAPHPTK